MDEREAIERLKRGDAGGLRALVETHYDRAARAAYLVVRDPALAEDVAQGAFVRAYDKIGTFDAKRPFAPWFMRLVVNDAAEAARRRERRRTLPLDSPGAGDAVSRFVDPASGPQELAEEAEERRSVWAALEKLPPAQRAVVVQRYFLDMSGAEMSERGNTPTGTIKWRLHAARKTLSELLRPERRLQGTPTEAQDPAPVGVAEGGNDRD
ncbi:MAG: RNA polymerase sigma factor [Rubrobacter sp.]|jgi:RNA polymerase sigma-70 factor (ECF subfamily)|nr:RNA polymerase sigma factor [Rubrobacter sp.]